MQHADFLSAIWWQIVNTLPCQYLPTLLFIKKNQWWCVTGIKHSTGEKVTGPKTLALLRSAEGPERRLGLFLAKPTSFTLAGLSFLANAGKLQPWKFFLKMTTGHFSPRQNIHSAKLSFSTPSFLWPPAFWGALLSSPEPMGSISNSPGYKNLLVGEAWNVGSVSLCLLKVTTVETHVLAFPQHMKRGEPGCEISTIITKSVVEELFRTHRAFYLLSPQIFRNPMRKVFVSPLYR